MSNLSTSGAFDLTNRDDVRRVGALAIRSIQVGMHVLNAARELFRKTGNLTPTDDDDVETEIYSIREAMRDCRNVFLEWTGGIESPRRKALAELLLLLRPRDGRSIEILGKEVGCAHLAAFQLVAHLEQAWGKDHGPAVDRLWGLQQLVQPEMVKKWPVADKMTSLIRDETALALDRIVAPAAVLPASTSTTDEGISFGALCAKIVTSPKTLRNFAKEVKSRVPDRGERNFRFTSAEELAIISRAAKHAGLKRTRDLAQQVLGNKEIKQQ